MKTNLGFSAYLLIFALAPLALATPAQRGPAANCAGSCTATNGTGAQACALASADPTPLALSAPAQAALLFQIDEERMARELYTAFGAMWGLQPFAHIPLAESRHETVLRQLATRAGLALPTAVAGRFDDQEVQKRYTSLLALGLESVDSALRVGAYVEEVDISDLKALIVTTDSTGLKDSAMALQTASGHHLNAFVGLLAARGVTYAPQVLSVENYEAILAAGGSRGQGQGQGQGMGQGRGRRAGRG